MKALIEAVDFWTSFPGLFIYDQNLLLSFSLSEVKKKKIVYFNLDISRDWFCLEIIK